LASQWDFGSSAMEARILRPLVWFGLLESRTEPRSPTDVVERRLYRKAPLFDRFLKFDVQIEGSDILLASYSGKQQIFQIGSSRSSGHFTDIGAACHLDRFDPPSTRR
jgi:hypothetical protein